MAFVIIVCPLDSQAMASTSPGLPQGTFPQVPLAANEQAGVMPAPLLGYNGLPLQMGIPPQAWHQYQQALAHAYNAAALGTAPMPPTMAGTVPPLTTMGNVLPPMPGAGLLPAPVTPLPLPTEAPMYLAPPQGYVAPTDGPTTPLPAVPLPQEGATVGTATGPAGPADETHGTTDSAAATAQAAGSIDPFTVGLGVPGLADPWQAHHVAQAINAAQAQARANAAAAAVGPQTAPQAEEFQATAGADQNDGMSQTPGLRPNTLFPESAAPNSPQLSDQDLWSGYTPNLQSGSWVNIQAPTRHESGTNYLLSRQQNLASFVNQLQADFAAPREIATAAWHVSVKVS